MLTETRGRNAVMREAIVMKSMIETANYLNLSYTKIGEVYGAARSCYQESSIEKLKLLMAVSNYWNNGRNLKLHQVELGGNCV
jgi:hypothetical protein